MFEIWPFSNFHDLNLDWIIKTIKEWDKKLDQFFNGGGIKKFVDEVLTEHPEWTTTVMDGSLELRKFTAALAMRTVNYYVTPEEYGAAGDGNTDDTDAVQAAFDDGRPVLMLADYKITAPLQVSEGLYMGKRAGRLLLNDTAGTASVHSAGVDNITMEGIAFKTQTQGHARYSVSLLSGDNIHVEKCYFEGVYGYGLRLNNTTNSSAKDLVFNTTTGVSGNPGGCIYAMDAKTLTVQNIKAYDIQDHVVYITGSDTGGTENLTISNINVELGGHNSLTNGAAVVVYNRASNINIDNVNVKNSKAALQISRSGSSLYVPKNVNISNVTGDVFTENGITIQGAQGYEIEDIALSNVNIGNCSQDGVSLAYIKGGNLNNINIGNCGRNCCRWSNIENITSTNIVTGNAGSENVICDPVNNSFISNMIVGSGTYGLYHRTGNAEYINIKGIGTYSSYAFSVAAPGRIQQGPDNNTWNEYFSQIYAGSAASTTVGPAYDGIITVRYAVTSNALHYAVAVDSDSHVVWCAQSQGGLQIVGSFPAKAGKTYTVTTDASEPKQIYLSSMRQAYYG